MPALSSPDRKVTHYRRGTRSADWATFLADCNDLTKKYVRAPVGTFQVTSVNYVGIRGQGKTIDFDGAILTLDDVVTMPVVIQSDSPNIEKQATATVTAETRTLTALDSDFVATVQPGDSHFVRIGVQKYDPQEPLYSRIRFVESIDGNDITYDKPFGIEADVYASEAALEAVTGYPERVGPWGTYSGSGTTVPNGFFQRGLGYDHGIRAVSNLAQDITLRNLVILYDGTERMYGAWSVVVGLSLRVHIENCLVVNPHGSAVHYFYTEDTLIDRFVAMGTGRGAPFGGTVKTNWGVMLSGWASNSSTFQNGILYGTDIEMCNFESGCRDLVIKDTYVRNRESGTPGVNTSTHFGAYGPGNVLFDNISVDITPGSSRMWTYAYDNEIRDLKILTDELPDYLDWVGNKGRITGTLQWGSHLFSEVEEVVVDFSVTTANGPIPYPEGIIRGAVWEIQDRSKFTSFNVFASDPFQANNPDLTFSTLIEKFAIPFGRTYAQYRSGLADHRIYTQNGGGPIRVTLSIMRKTN